MSKRLSGRGKTALIILIIHILIIRLSLIIKGWGIGIYQHGTNIATGEILNTFAMITKQDHELMEQAHNTGQPMPTILSDTLAKEGMREVEKKGTEEIVPLQIPPKEMEAISIRKDFREPVTRTGDLGIGRTASTGISTRKLIIVSLFLHLEALGYCWFQLY